MATGPTPITLQTDLRKLEPASDFKLQDVLYCQIRVKHAVGVSTKQDIPSGVDRAICRAAKNYLETKTDHVTSTVNYGAFFADPSSKAKFAHDLTNKFVLLAIHRGQDQPPAEISDFDYESACISNGAAHSIVFENAPSVFVRTPRKAQWHRTQIITSAMPPAEINSAVKTAALAIASEQEGLSVHCHALVVGTQSLNVGSLLLSSAEGNDFVVKKAGIDISLVAIDELLRVIRSPTALPTNSPSAQDSDGLTLL
jgi:hypothetical protein